MVWNLYNQRKTEGSELKTHVFSGASSAVQMSLWHELQVTCQVAMFRIVVHSKEQHSEVQVLTAHVWALRCTGCLCRWTKLVCRRGLVKCERWLYVAIACSRHTVGKAALAQSHQACGEDREGQRVRTVSAKTPCPSSGCRPQVKWPKPGS